MRDIINFFFSIPGRIFGTTVKGCGCLTVVMIVFVIGTIFAIQEEYINPDTSNRSGTPIVTTAPSSANTTPRTSSNTEWREFLRAYERWIDNYVRIMKRIADDPSDFSAITDSVALAIEMIEWAERAEQIESELTGDDLREYLATLSRIILKLSEVF
jgi:DNA-binding ferritin-like protein (Dps family)